MNPNYLRLYLVTDSSMLQGRQMEDVVLAAIEGGVTAVQLREKNCTTLEFLRKAQRLKAAMQPTNVPLIINDRLDIALAVGADGLHIGQEDLTYPIARKYLGTDKIIGLSVENMTQVMEAERFEVDYIGVSPVFSTQTKLDTQLPFGLDGLRTVAQTTQHLIVAIGGIHAHNAAAVMAAGANGIAVVSAIMASEQPLEAARKLWAVVA